MSGLAHTVQNLNPMAHLLSGFGMSKSNFIYKSAAPGNAREALDPVGLTTKPVAPTPIAPKIVPMPDQDAIDAAARKARAKQLGRGGFASTILSQSAAAPTQTSDRLGP